MIQNRRFQTPPVTKNLLIINILMFALTLLSQDNFNANQYLGLYPTASDNFQPYQIITAIFMHGSISHIFFNMFALWMFGSGLEKVWGPRKFLFFYLVCGIGANLIMIGVNYFEYQQFMAAMESVIQNPNINDYEAFLRHETPWADQWIAEISNLSKVTDTQMVEEVIVRRLYEVRDVWTNIPMVGASGALYGVLVGFGFTFPEAKLMLIFLPFVPIKAKYFIPFMVALEFFLGSSGITTGIAHFAHVAGAVIGLILILLWRSGRGPFRRG